MGEGGKIANAISFNAGISACEKGKQWQQALPLFHKMRKTGMTADVISCRTAISAESSGSRHWQWFMHKDDDSNG